jgi:hypothetical protein
LAVLKAVRFGDFLSRIPQGNGINDINMSNINERQAIPKTFLLKPIAKPVVENQPLMQKPKLSFLIKEKLKNSENERYTIPVKKKKIILKPLRMPKRCCGGMRVVWLQEPRLQCGDRKQDSGRTTKGRTTGTQQPNRQRKYVRSSPARALDLYRIPNHCAQQEQGTQQDKAHNQKLRQQGDLLMFLGLG